MHVSVRAFVLGWREKLIFGILTTPSANIIDVICRRKLRKGVTYGIFVYSLTYNCGVVVPNACLKFEKKKTIYKQVLKR